MEKENPNYIKFINYFKEVTLAEKPQFMYDTRGNFQYEFFRNEFFSAKAVQLLEKRKGLYILSVQLEDTKGRRFIHTFATKKSLHQVKKDWGKPKRAKDWLREDIKFHLLRFKPLLQLRQDLHPHPEKYILLKNLQIQIRKEPQKIKLER